MFESVRTMDDRPNGLLCFASFLASVAVHAAIIGMIVLVPLVFCNVLPENPIIAMLRLDPPTPVPPDPPAPPPARPAASGEVTIKEIKGDVAPIKIPDRIIPDAPDEGLDPNYLGRMINGIPGPNLGVGPTSVVERFLPSDVDRPDKEPVRPKPVVPITSFLLQSKLLRRVDPVYPRMAVITHTTGDVVLEAVIDEEGNVTDIKVVSGHPLLMKAAVEAVEQWKYSSTILGGEPRRVVANVTITFILRH